MLPSEVTIGQAVRIAWGSLFHPGEKVLGTVVRLPLTADKWERPSDGKVLVQVRDEPRPRAVRAQDLEVA
jgi:hypothetical protein